MDLVFLYDDIPTEEREEFAKQLVSQMLRQYINQKVRDLQQYFLVMKEICDLEKACMNYIIKGYALQGGDGLHWLELMRVGLGLDDVETLTHDEIHELIDASAQLVVDMMHSKVIFLSFDEWRLMDCDIDALWWMARTALNGDEFLTLEEAIEQTGLTKQEITEQVDVKFAPLIKTWLVAKKDALSLVNELAKAEA